MHTIEATYRINTPMFIAGAEQDKEAELRLPSFKGALRFWWRALAYGRYEGDLTQIREKEDEIFGSTNGQAKLLFHLKTYLDCCPKGNDKVLPERFGGLAYLGYGVCESFTSGNRNSVRGRLTRSCIKPSQEFKVNILWNNKIDEFSKEYILLKDALKILGLLGGLGSKSRKGYGSLTLISMVENHESCFNNPKNREELEKRLLEILTSTPLPKNIPLYSAFSHHTKIDLLNNDHDPLIILNSIGEALQQYRGWYTEKNFKDDHDIAMEIANDGVSQQHPRRIIFGLPHNYYFSSIKKKADFNANGNGIDRRSSPLCFHIHFYGENNYEAIALIFKSDFLPVGVKIKAKRNLLENKVDYSVLDQLIDGQSKNSKTPYFPKRKPILGVQVNKEGSK